MTARGRHGGAKESTPRGGRHGLSIEGATAGRGGWVEGEATDTGRCDGGQQAQVEVDTRQRLQ